MRSDRALSPCPARAAATSSPSTRAARAGSAHAARPAASLFAQPLLAWLGAAALLAGCASPAAEESPPPAFATAPAVMPAAAPAAPPAPPVAPAPTVPADGTVARFVGTATQLPATTGALLDQLAQDKRARWEIKGYSERQVNKTAREVALARALAVRKELVARGVPAQNLRVKYSTEEAREAVTVLPQAAEGKRAEAAPAPAKAPPAKR